MKRAPFLIPALLRFAGTSARQDAWGRLLKLTAGGAELSTSTRLAKGEMLSAKFELGGEILRAAAEVTHVEKDDDGQTLAELRWSDMVERKRLARVLLDVVSRS